MALPASNLLLMCFCCLACQSVLGQDLGSARGYGVLSGSTLTSTGLSVVDGSIGVWPGTAITGFPPGVVLNGSIHNGDDAARQAQADVTAAYDRLVLLPFTRDLSGTDLGGATLVPGVYFFSSSAQLSSILTLDALGDPNAVFVFQIGSTLTTATGSSVLNVNGADGCNVYWQVGSSATLGVATSFTGNVLAAASITLGTGSSITDGGAFARTGAVTMDSNRIVACIPTAGTAGGLAVLGFGFVGRRVRR